MNGKVSQNPILCIFHYKSTVVLKNVDACFLDVSFYRPQKKFAKVMFLQVSVCPHGGGVRGFIWGRVWFYSGGMRGFIQGGMRGFIQGGHAWFYLGGHAWFYWGACMVLFGGHAWFFQFFRIQSDTVNKRAVRILLECILVIT